MPDDAEDKRRAALDETVIAGLRELQDEESPEFLAELVEAYLQDVRRRLRELESLGVPPDPSRAAAHFHSLKGSSLNIGALPFAELCREAEAAARRCEWIPDVLDLLSAEFRRVEVALAQEGKAS